MKSLLFICWDGPQVNYLEGLFFPILDGLKDKYRIHVIQFTWGAQGTSDGTSVRFAKAGMRYQRYTVSRRPHVAAGTILTLWSGTRYLKRYARENKIDILLPRSTFPSLMVLAMGKTLAGRRLVFDADGLPLEERVDFAGLNPGGMQYRFLKQKESRVIGKADRILTRTKAAIPLLTGTPSDPRFHVVSNGRDPRQFRPLSADERERIRTGLGLDEKELVLVYCGSLGPQYCVQEMLALPELAAVHGIACKLLVLTGSPELLGAGLSERVIVRSLPFSEVPRYLGAADIGLAIREPFPSMAGVAPIKLGEYLLCGLPVLASRGIGDTGVLLDGWESCHLLGDHSREAFEEAVRWMALLPGKDRVRADARELGLKHFSLEESIASYRKALEDL